MSVSAEPPKRDHFLKVPLIVAAAGPLGVVCLLASPIGVMILAMIPFLLAWLCASLAMLVVALNCGEACQWKGMISALVGPMVLVLAILDVPDFAAASARGSEYLHFGLLSPYYIAKVESLPRDGARFARFDWGGMSFASQALVYDESDEIRLPAGTQSPAWLARTQHSEFACEGWGRRHLLGHFYIAYFPC